MTEFDIDGDLVRKLAGLLDETGLSEIEFAAGDRRIRVTRQLVAAAAPAAAAAPPAAAADPNAPAALPDGGVPSPMVGTIYLAPEPGGPPFVRPGDSVAEGDTLLIIEAMKVMNPIRAPRAGVVQQVLVKDAQPVEYGDMLMVIA